MRIFLIQPAAMLGESYAVSAQPFLPLGLASLAAILREAGHEVRLLDAYTEGWEHRGVLDGGVVEIGVPEEDVASQVRRFQPQVVGFGVPFGAQIPRLKSLAGWVKAIHSDIFVICGGNIPTVSPLEILTDSSIDAVCLGEGEVSFLRTIQSMEIGEGLQNCPGIAYRSASGIPIVKPSDSRNIEPDLLPLPAYDLLPMKKYFRIMGERFVPLVPNRGCNANCSVCSSRDIFGNQPRRFSADYLFRQIEHLTVVYGIDDLAIYDHNFLNDSELGDRFLDQLIKRNLRIRWIAHCCLSGEGFGGDLFSKIRRAGGVELHFDIGSGSRRVLMQILKRELDLHRIEENALLALANGLRVSVRFLLGLPGETVEEMYETLNFAWKLRSRGVEGFEFEIAQPYAGTELRNRALELGFHVPKHDAALDPFANSWQYTDAAVAEVQAIRDTAQREFSNRGMVFDWTRRLSDNLRLPKKFEQRYFQSVAPQPQLHRPRPSLRMDRRTPVKGN